MAPTPNVRYTAYDDKILAAGLITIKPDYVPKTDPKLTYSNGQSIELWRYFAVTAASGSNGG